MSGADFSIRGDTSLDSSGFSAGLNKMASISAKVFAGLVTGATAAIGAIGGIGMAYNATMEKYQTNLTTMLNGNAQVAKKLTGEIEKMASQTPLAMNDLMDAAQTLMAFGAADETNMVKTLQMIGDVAMGDSQKLQSLSLAFGQMYSTGKLQGQDLLQMINAGFNPLIELEKMGYGTVASLKEQMSKGAISVEMVTKAFEHATQEGGQFYNAMENQSKTFQGQMSTMKDNANALCGALAEGLFQSASTTLLPAVNEWIDILLTATKENGIQGAIDVSGEIIANAISMFTSALPQLISTGINIVNSLMQGISQSMPLITESAVQVINQLVTGFMSFLTTFITVGGSIIAQLVNGIALSLPELVKSALDSLMMFVNTIISNFSQILSTGEEILYNLVDGILNSIPSIIDSAVTIISSIVTTIVNNLPKILEMGIKLVIYIIKGITQQIPKVVSKIFELCKNIIEAIKSIDWISLGKDIIHGLINGIGAMAGLLWEAAVNVAKNALDGIKSFFGIHSPSRVMRDQVGKMIPQGMAIGIEADTKKVEDAMKVMNQKGLQAIEQNQRFMPNYPTAFSGSDKDNEEVKEYVNNVQNIYFQQPVETPDEVARTLRIEQTYGLAGDY